MEPQQPLGQPINPNPGDPHFVPQPLGSPPQKPRTAKKLWILLGGAIGILLVLGVAYWAMSKSATEAYGKDVAAYKQQIKDVRDGMNAALDEQDISIREPEAPPVFEEYGIKLQGVIAAAPQPPKVLLVIPAGDDATKNEAKALTTAATNYANELRRIYDLFEFYTTTAEDFKPIKDLGTFTVFNPQEIKAVPGLWATFMEKFKALPPPGGLEPFKADLVAQGEILQTKFTELADGYDSRTTGQNDDLITELSKLADAFNEAFQKNAATTTNEAIDKVNQYYDELDALI
ncbi:MAG: hypothetical protein ACREGD_00415 [Candidatus Saccharimonadales bacterium]